ncbi:hypothetical protein CHS0354_000876 [Potamilus streckersoni]|uniref:Uncharacterized protein n=1 Tax=Potamilus streckersoni TaxID=2493646 RepID=A0AAE0VX48_9BIVA|nr:hypothetical protein CHS0354_000876 [Potamilus streckersoni]
MMIYVLLLLGLVLNIQSDATEPHSDGIKPQSDGINRQSDGIKSKLNGIKPKSDGIQSQSHDMRPQSDDNKYQSDGTKHQSDSINLQSDGIKPQSYGIESRQDDIASNKSARVEMRSRDRYTAGNTMCWPGEKCGFHQGTSYSWCITDNKRTWDYCCTGPCQYGFEEYMWCRSGHYWQYCGNAGGRDIYGRECLLSFPCGMHQEVGKESYYWCYVDAKKTWGRCCNMYSMCEQGHMDYFWCYTGYKMRSDWQYCNPSYS